MKLEMLVSEKLGKAISESSNQEIYQALMAVVQDMAEQKESNAGKKKVYYVSAEFLIGKLLSNNMINLGIYEDVRKMLAANGKDICEIEEIEAEPSLGNGGLGRLAACFLDSIATLGYNGAGIGLNYHLGLFQQKFADHMQKETKNQWMDRSGWLKRTDVGFPVSDDSDEDGRKLRIYQQYFMVSNGAQLILKECEARGCNLYDLPDYAVIQINDTHPTMIIPELIRLLIARGLSVDDAIDVVSRTCAYTNHTILAEALEKWPLHYLQEIVPQLVPIIEILDDKVRRKYADESVAVIDRNDVVHMAHIDIHYGFSVNGVAALHTEILKETELHHFYQLYPEKFNNKTNGITFRRWLLYCNPLLTDQITEWIGDGYKKDAAELKKLEKFASDEQSLQNLLQIKKENKHQLSEYLKRTQGIELNENSVFDIQIKRLHEYKRQQMNALYVIYKYLEIKSGKLPKTPITVIFGAKAAPAYVIAKDIIHLILCLQELVNQDPEVSPYLNVVMVENYNVTLAEKLIPACDISEQISLASKEASGTGNMKFMLNGAVTLGTEDGANVEIHQFVGDDNIYIFGAKSDEVIAHYEKSDYRPSDYYTKNPMIQKAVEFITGPQMMEIGKKENLERLSSELKKKDWFMTFLDLEDYIRTKERALEDYTDRKTWAKKMLANISNAGFFSSDRTIREYNRDIWKLGD